MIWYGILLCQDVVINEFLASNSTVVADNFGEFDDWIELYNISDNDVDLSGWYLSDDITNPDKWSFPDLTITSGGYLVIWADDDEEQGNDHAGFKLSVSGESIILSDSNLNQIDQIVYGSQTTDISLGQFPNGSGDFIQMYPTFGAVNTNNYIPGEDFSELLFQEFIVQKFDLHFYDDNWTDLLEYNYYSGEVYLPAQLTYNDTVVLDSIGVRYKGNSSYMQSSTTPKKPFKFRFDKYIDDQLLCEVAKLNFSNCVKDPTFMREVIAYQIAEDLVPAPRTAYANILVDGELLGFYVQVEQIDEFFINRHYVGSLGNLFKASDDGATMLYHGSDPSDYEAEFDIKTNEDVNDWSDLITMLDNLNNCSSSTFCSTMENYLDLDGCAAMLAFNMVLSHYDSYTGSGRNYYLYHDLASDQFKFLPWDLNETFGCYNNNWNVINQDIMHISNLDDRPLNRRILDNELYCQSYRNYINELITETASLESISEMISELQNFVDPYIQADPNKLYTYQDFLTNIDEDVSIGLGQIIPGLKSFSQLRNTEIADQLTDVAVFPGDCDNNGIVNELDILPIGINFLSTGDPRYETSFVWQNHFTPTWIDTAVTYADANGDGIVNEIDVIGIGVNWRNTHNTPGSSYVVDPDEPELLKQHRSTFHTIYNSLNGNGEDTRKIKFILNSIYNFSDEIPAVEISLSNYPNPFNPSTTISFEISNEQNEQIKLEIYNLKGQKIKQLISDQLSAGQHSIVWNGTDDNDKPVSSGIYFYKLESGSTSQTKKMILMK